MWNLPVIPHYQYGLPLYSLESYFRYLEIAQLDVQEEIYMLHSWCCFVKGASRGSNSTWFNVLERSRVLCLFKSLDSKSFLCLA